MFNLQKIVIDHAQDPVKYFMSLLWYLAYNAVKKGKVSDPRDYAFSSIKHYLYEKYIGKLKITLHEFFLNLSDKFTECLEVLLEMEREYKQILASSYC